MRKNKKNVDDGQIELNSIVDDKQPDEQTEDLREPIQGADQLELANDSATAVENAFSDAIDTQSDVSIQSQDSDYSGDASTYGDSDFIGNAKTKNDNPKKEKRQKKPLTKTAKIIIAAALVLLSALLVFGGVFAYRIFHKPQNLFAPPKPTPVATILSESSSPTSLTSPVPSPTPSEYERTLSLADKQLMKNTVNFMIVGVDYTTERSNWHKYFYSDVMIIVAVNFEENKVDMISVPRDTYAKIHNVEGRYKMNSSFYWGGGLEKEGFFYTMKSCEWILGGIPIDYYIGATMPIVKDLVNAIDGVDYDVDVDFKIQGRSYEKGMQHLDGQGVLDYFRVRKGVDNDLGRVNRQKKLLIAAFTKLKSTNLIFKAPDIIKAMEGKCFTNLSFEQMCALAAFGSKLPIENIKMHTMGGPLINIYNWNFVITNQNDRVELIKEVFGVDAPKMSKYSYSFCRQEWEGMQARKYIDLVKNALAKDAKLEEPKILATDKEELLKSVAHLESLKNKGEKESEAARLSLQSQATTIFNNAGIKITWFVNENPGKKRLTG